MPGNIYYNADQLGAEVFAKFPLFLLHNKKYAKLTNDDRVAYMVIKDRMKLSLSNNWFDDQRRVYVIYTRDQLKEDIHVGKNKVATIKKHLVDADLLEVKKMGFDPRAKKNLPDRYYLKLPKYEAGDLISQDSQVSALQPSGRPNLGRRQQNDESTAVEPKLDRENSNKVPSTLETSGRPILGQYQDNNIDTIKETNKETENWDFSEKNYSPKLVAEQNQDLLHNLGKALTTDDDVMFLDEDSIDLICMWFRTPQGVSDCISTILNAANASRKEATDQIGHYDLFFEDHEGELKGRVTNKLRRYFNKMRTAKKGEIKNPKNYLFISMRNMFDDWQQEVLREESK